RPPDRPPPPRPARSPVHHRDRWPRLLQERARPVRILDQGTRGVPQAARAGGAAMNRRTLLPHTLVGGAATALGVYRAPSLGASVRWPIGCFNRPWTTWSFDEALKH